MSVYMYIYIINTPSKVSSCFYFTRVCRRVSFFFYFLFQRFFGTVILDYKSTRLEFLLTATPPSATPPAGWSGLERESPVDPCVHE